MTIVSLLMWLPYAVCTFLLFQAGIIEFLSSKAIVRLEFPLTILYFPSSIRKFLSRQELVRLQLPFIILFFMNSLVNPIVYTIRIPECRKAFLLLFKRQRRQNARDIPLHAL